MKHQNKYDQSKATSELLNWKYNNKIRVIPPKAGLGLNK